MRPSDAGRSSRATGTDRSAAADAGSARRAGSGKKQKTTVEGSRSQGCEPRASSSARAEPDDARGWLVRSTCSRNASSSCAGSAAEAEVVQLPANHGPGLDTRRMCGRGAPEETGAVKGADNY